MCYSNNAVLNMHVHR